MFNNCAHLDYIKTSMTRCAHLMILCDLEIVENKEQIETAILRDLSLNQKPSISRQYLQFSPFLR